MVGSPTGLSSVMSSPWSDPVPQSAIISKNTQPTPMIDLDLSPIVHRAQALANEGRYEDADALFAEFSEWFVQGSDADQGVLLCPSL